MKTLSNKEKMKLKLQFSWKKEGRRKKFIKEKRNRKKDRDR